MPTADMLKTRARIALESMRYQAEIPGDGEQDSAGTRPSAETPAPARPPQSSHHQPAPASGERYGGWKPDFPKPEAARFIEARNATKRPQYLSPLQPGDWEGKDMFVSADGKVGAAVAPDGDIQNVFTNEGPKGAGAEAIMEAMNRGGHTLDCYAGHLPLFYAQCGFVETGRRKFNREYAPPNWDDEHDDDPDVVFTALGEHLNDEQIRNTVGQPRSEWTHPAVSSRYYTDWDAARFDS